jgi:hypothetical protein
VRHLDEGDIIVGERDWFRKGSEKVQKGSRFSGSTVQKEVQKAFLNLF